MSLLLSTLLSSLIPIGAEGLKQVIANKVGGVKPLTIDDQIKLDNNEVQRLQALAALDNPGGTPTQWVIDLRASSRYIAAWACILIGAGMVATGVLQAASAALVAPGSELISVAFGFLFGTRVVAGFGKK